MQRFLGGQAGGNLKDPGLLFKLKQNYKMLKIRNITKQFDDNLSKEIDSDFKFSNKLYMLIENSMLHKMSAPHK